MTAATIEPACIVCGGDSVRDFFRMPSVPVFCNVLGASRDQAANAPRGDVCLCICEDCGHIHNRLFDPNLVAYSEDYDNALHFSPHFQAYLEDLARQLIHRHGLYDKDVVEIGCGKGDFLALLCTLGQNRGIGFDHAVSQSPEPLAASPAIELISDEFTRQHAQQISADFFVCRHVLEHLAQPSSLLRSALVPAARREGAASYFEVPNARYMLDTLSTWDVIYEHCSYFSEVSLRKLFTLAGFSRPEVYTAFHDQFLCLQAAAPQKAGAGPEGHTEAGRDVASLLSLTGRFAACYAEKKARWTETLARYGRSGQSVLVWGAGSKGVAFLNECARETPEVIKAVVDVSPRKQGRFVPGLALPVIAPGELRGVRVDTALIMNPAYRNEIAGMLDAVGIDAAIEVV